MAQNSPKTGIETLSAKQLRSISLLCQGRQQVSIAAELHCGVETLRRWLKDPTYQAALIRGRRQVWVEVMSEASLGLGTALNVLQRIMINEETPPSSRVQAASKFIELVRPLDLVDDAEVVAVGDQAQVFVWLPDNQRGDRVPDGPKPEQQRVCNR